MAQYQSSLTGPEIDAALTDMARHDSEAWAVGTRDGSAVSSLDITYHNNAEYYATNAQSAAARAEAAVPSGTAGAVFFDRVQSLTDAQKTQAQTNIGAQSNDGGVLKIGTYVSIGQARIPNHTSVPGWYRVADIDNSGLANIIYPQVFVMASGNYTSYRPTEFAIAGSFPQYGGNVYARMTQLSGYVGQNYTRFRVSNDDRVFHIELYYSQNSSSGSGATEFFIAAIGGTLITYEPTAPISADPANVVIDHALKTTPTGAFGDSVFPTPAVVSVSSIATLKTQLTTWQTAQGSYAVGFYNVSFSAAASPFVSGAKVNVELKTASGAYGVAVLTTYGSSNPEMYLMRLYNGTWGDPKKVTIAS